jgi:hypothetical protein
VKNLLFGAREVPGGRDPSLALRMTDGESIVVGSQVRNSKMEPVITRTLKEGKDGIEGYAAFPDRTERGPGL